jgi:DtxR family Mn-dependent transcriptional regulator
VLSDEVEEAMNRVLGNPTTCPHGNPIPGSDYEAPDAIRLTDVPTGSRFTVSRIPEELEFTDGMLEFLESSNLLPGSSGTVTSETRDGLVVDVNGNSVTVDEFASARILVTV